MSVPSRRPTLAELVVATRRLLEHNQPISIYERRVAASLLGIVERELAQGAAFARADQARLASLLGRERDLPDLVNELCEQIAAGAFDDRGAELVRVLKAGTLEKLAIDNPRYPAYQRAVAGSKEPPSEGNS
jgi:hypothetical protein